MWGSEQNISPTLDFNWDINLGTSYSAHNDTRNVNILPDFSYAGYRGGGVLIPNIKNNIVILEPQLNRMYG